jgi:hypothetical protein
MIRAVKGHLRVNPAAPFALINPPGQNRRSLVGYSWAIMSHLSSLPIDRLAISLGGPLIQVTTLNIKNSCQATTVINTATIT